MTTPHSEPPVHLEQKPSADQIAADIEQTRQELDETLQALAAKMDVKTRTKNKVIASKEQVLGHVDAAQARATELTLRARDASTDSAGRPEPIVWIVAGVVTSAAVMVAMWRRRR